jgi:hypothetical protein
MTIAPRRWARFPAGDGRRARWDHHLDAIATLRDRLVGGRTIIGTISRHLANRIVNLIQQQRYLRRIVCIPIRQRLCHNRAAGGVNRQMQLSPFPARLRTMLRLQSLTRPVHLQTRAVDQYV